MKTYKQKYLELYKSYSNLVKRLAESNAISDARKIQLDTTGLFDPVEFQEMSKKLMVLYSALDAIKEIEFTYKVSRTNTYMIAEEALLQTRGNGIDFLNK